MPVRIEAPDGTIVEFPDGTSDAVMERAMAQAYPKPKAPRPTPRPTAGQAIRAAANTTSARLAEGLAAPMEMLSTPGRLVNRGINRVIGGVGDAVLRGLGMNAPANTLMRTMQGVDRQLANPRPVTTITERNSPLDQRTGGAMGDFVGQMASGMLLPIPGGPKPRPRIPTAPARATAAQQIVREGQRQGVRVLTSDVRPPRTFVGKTAQATGERIIGMGTGGVRQAQQAERVQAVRNLASEFGVVDDGAGLIDDVAADLAKTRGTMLDKLTAAKNSVIEGIQGPVSAPNATRAIDDQIARLSGINSDAFAPVIAKLQNFKGELANGKTLAQIEGNRKLLGDLFSDPSLAAIKGDGQKALNAIYGPLRDDMGTFIKANGGQQSYTRWKGANDRLAAMAGELDEKAFKAALGKTDITPEAVGTLLFNNSPSSIRRLARNLSPAGRVKAQTAIIGRAIEKAGGMDNISPEKFTGEVGRLGKSIGVFFQGDDIARVDGLSRLLAATRRASEASVSPPTGVQNAMAGLYGGAGVIGGVPGLIGVQAYGSLARAYESAPVRDALLKLGKTTAGSKGEAAMLRRASVVLSSQIAKLSESPAVSGMNDNVGVSAAAGDGQEYQQEQ